MRHMRGLAYFLSVLLVAAGVTATLQSGVASADQITSRSLTLVGVGNVGQYGGKNTARIIGR